MIQTAYNPQVRFVPWHLPSVLEPSTSPTDEATRETTVPGRYKVDDPQAERWFQRWKSGTTGFPWIDALMRQLRHDGWVHHLGRHSLACFLTRGGCYVHWERGAEVFQELLLDHEPACNGGNWQWLSCTAFFTQYYRCYSPVSFPQKWDKYGNFVRRWLPELKGLPAKYIYEPWKAPIADLKKAGVKLVESPGVDGEMAEGTYPKPMFDFGERRTICMASLKKAYSVGLRGDDKRVLDGSWRELFEGGGDDEEVMGDTDQSDDGRDADNGDADNKKPSRKRSKQGPMDRHVKKQKT
jgi:cryptochrome